MSTRCRALVLLTTGIISFTCFAPRLQAIGDVDFDGDVDNFDLMVVLDNQGLIGVAGDVDMDFDVDAVDYSFAKVSFDSNTTFGGSLSAPPANSNSAKLIYDASTGALLLDQSNAPGGILSAFLLQSNAAFNDVSPITYPFATSPANYNTRTTSIVAQAHPGAALGSSGLTTNPHNLGSLLNPGLSLADLQMLSLQGVYTGQIIQQGAGSHLRSFEIIVVPEPVTYSLALAAVIAAAHTARLQCRRLHPTCY